MEVVQSMVDDCSVQLQHSFVVDDDHGDEHEACHGDDDDAAAVEVGHQPVGCHLACQGGENAHQEYRDRVVQPVRQPQIPSLREEKLKEREGQRERERERERESHKL